jgi:protein-L-isoaspartate O-methyltransferase
VAEPPLVEASRRAGVADPRVLEAIRVVDRRGFVSPELTKEAQLTGPCRFRTAR